MSLPLSEARSIFTKRLSQVYREAARPTMFFKQFFADDFGDQKNVSIEVERNTESVAVDVLRGTEGNRNTFDRSSEKTYTPPYYDEYFDARELDFYDKLFGTNNNGNIDPVSFGEYLSEIARKLLRLEDKINRAYELQASQVLFDGIIQLTNGDNIDFKRKSGSLVDGSGTTWATGTNDPTSQLVEGANFIRQNGKYQGGTFNVVMADDAFQALLDNDTFQAKADLRNVQIADVSMPIGMPEGAVLHGQISGGSYKFNIWGYPQFYKPKGGSITPYVQAKKIVMLPITPMFVHAYAGVPHIMTAPENSIMPEFVGMRRGAFHIDNVIDRKKFSHEFRVRSAGILVPTAVDAIYTRQVLA